MENPLSGTRRQLLAIVAVSVLVGLLCAAINTSGFPPRVHSKGLLIGAASTHVLIDSPAKSILLRRPLPQDQNTLVDRGELLGRLIVSPLVIDRISRRIGVPSRDISGLVRITASAPLSFTEPGSERRASDIQGSTRPYRLEVQARQWTPIVDIYAQAPSAQQAVRLANAAVLAARQELQGMARSYGRPQDQLVVLRQLGPARGQVVNKRVPMVIGTLTFLVAFCLSVAALLGVLVLARRRKAARELGPERQAVRYQATDWDEPASDAWPHTTRVLPWMLAGFLLILWLMPFNVITLNASLPIDLNFDRLVLPLIIAVWLFAVAAGGRAAPRLRMTWIHAAFGAFVAVAFLSVVLDARYLNQSLELDLSLKKLPLLVSYGGFFIIAASGVRRSEVKAFLNFSLILGVICALGMLYEYRFKVNLFYQWSDRLLPGIFTVAQSDASAVDSMGRRLVSGPAELPLEAVTMLCMALPIALVGFVHAQRWRGRLLYGLAVCTLLAATFATYRKSAMIAPLSIGLTVAYFRRRDLVKLAPLGLAAVVGVSVLSPGAIGSTVSQFTRSDRLDVPTVSDRTSDYDAVRPDVWSHVAFGRGWGSYNHESYRILDSEILQRIIETGVLGLLAFLLVGAAVVLNARSTIASRHPVRAPPALAGAAAAVGFLVSSTLYDILSFPHATYLFLWMAGLVAVAVAPVRRPAPAAPGPHGGRDHRARLRPVGGRGPAHATHAAAEAQIAEAGGRWSLRRP